MKPIIYLSFFALLLSACKTSGIKPGSDTAIDYSETDLEIVKANNRFSLELFKNSYENKDENILLSPFSASMVLAMTANGSKESTLSGMTEALRLGSFSQEERNSFYQKAFHNLKILDPKTHIQVANSIWHKDDFSVEKSFLDMNKKYFQATVQGLDFSRPESAETINEWVRENTQNKIDGIIDGQIPQDMMLYLVNALYFKGEWMDKFNTDKTQKANFHLKNGKVEEVPFMHKSSLKAGYYEDETAEYIELPYGNGSYSMLISLPNEKSSLEAYMEKESLEYWQEVKSKLKETKIDLRLPKFKFDFEESLNNSLAKMGMTEAFNESADFSGIHPTAALMISEVKQKAFIEVNEEGTEASAATGVGIVVTSMPMLTKVNVNRPFSFVIQENDSGLILFKGIVSNPNLQ
ncbi:MAG TPA: serpin family protein [Sphingobacterium sp.]|nr:serpin family protein [Sphingobacterium sp.]